MKRFKKKEILDEFRVELKESVPETIRKLQEVCGPCSEKDSNEFLLSFLCNNKGRFRVDDYNSNQIYHDYHRLGYPGRTAYVEGYITSENGKTVAYGQCIFNHRYNNMRAVGLVVDVIAMILYTIMCIIEILPLSPFPFAIFVIASVMMIVAEIQSGNNESYNRMSDLAIMKEEALRRIAAVDRWDD